MTKREFVIRVSSLIRDSGFVILICMSYMYKILAVVGWSWTAIVAVYLIIRLRARGEIKPNEKQS
jgi:hypothetical protein